VLRLIAEQLADPEVGRLTLVGLGGVGKTRLAVAALHARSELSALPAITETSPGSISETPQLTTPGSGWSPPRGHALRSDGAAMKRSF
jgi:hypothetical protein